MLCLLRSTACIDDVFFLYFNIKHNFNDTVFIFYVYIRGPVSHTNHGGPVLHRKFHVTWAGDPF